MRRAPRAPRDPELERQKIADRTLETWIDDGSVRDEARQGEPTRPSPRHRPEASRAEAARSRRSRPNSSTAVGKQRGARLAERLAQASEALDRERYQEAQRLAGAIVKEAPDVADRARGARSRLLPARSVQAGRPLARGGASICAPIRSIMPVVADCYRALGRWSSVDRVWREIKAMSPSHEVLAEGRIVAAGALADQGDLRGAIAVMEPATKRAKTVRDHHLRQWYVLGDLYDRVGDPISARRWFAAIAEARPRVRRRRSTAALPSVAEPRVPSAPVPSPRCRACSSAPVSSPWSPTPAGR